MSDNTANIIDDRSATVTMLSEPLAWRVRAVEKISIDAASTCLRRRSVQVAPLRHVLRRHLPDDNRHGPYTHAVLAVFVAPFPRGPLLDFDVEGPYGSASLLPRAEIATREAMYLEHLALECGITVSDTVRPLLIAVLGYSGPWDDTAPDELLQNGLPFALAEQTLVEWTKLQARCADLLADRVGSLDLSAVASPLMVMPELAANGFWSTESDGSVLLDSYVQLLEQISRLAVSAVEELAPLANEFFVAFADYANSYDLMAVMRVPLDEPFVVKCSERRTLRLDPKRNSGFQELVIADARTNHVTVKVEDPNARLAKAAAYKEHSSEYADGALLTRRNDQYVAFYSHDPNRDYRIRIEFTLGLLSRLESVPFFASLLIVLLCLAMWNTTDIDVRTLALLGGPAALAASVLVGREQSTLASRLRLRGTAVLSSTLALLVATVVILYVLRVD